MLDLNVYLSHIMIFLFFFLLHVGKIFVCIKSLYRKFLNFELKILGHLKSYNVFVDIDN